MESLAALVAILMLTALLSGPVAIALSAIKTDKWILNIFRKLFHGFFVTISLWIGMMFFLSPSMPFFARLIGLYALTTGFIASRREYFPDIKIVSQLFARFGIQRKAVNKSGEGLEASGDGSQANTKRYSSMHGPIIKWRRNGRSGGDDGHGPSGQH